ncbi:MgtC/SapB family protein [Frigidibacter sp. ROC022]|uniref:MgtC/SapB family protein n=1 Tax=Frigidibacter sp. ROC022 TaxID=2971796 RepID=UPI00215AA04F|nr:MgtC/SapB family protein [Frigidibacter sp. ROC022]MCR8725324.1 MgtC/SapB family protein [Frigidibacter sp. ROC022]
MLSHAWGELTATPLSLSWTAMLLRLLSAGLLGGIVGLEREWHRKPAGLRTHIMVAVGACLFALLAFEVVADANAMGGPTLRVDPLRLVAAVTTGIGFLAGGTILASGGHVTGLTTAADLWVVSAIGLACGLGQIGLAALATALVLLVLVGLRWAEDIGPKKDRHRRGPSSGDGPG